ncbi:MAG: sensor histidine kinase [Anaerolineae bacterium]
MTDSITFRKGTETFRPRARLVSVLGEQLIRDATVGLLELVKNGYDADADTVTVKLLNLANPAKTTIIVEDDGYGMDLDTILYKWLEPATGHKEAAKEREQRTLKGRLPLGEKGVGRFAAHKLGRQLTLISRARDQKGVLSENEVVVTIDWDKFEADIYLSDVAIDYEERKPQHFVNSSGTLMEMHHARSAWKEKDVERVSRALLRLKSPFRTPKSFNVELICPEYPKFQELDHGELLKTAHTQMIFVVDDDGIADYEYDFKLPPYPSRRIEPQKEDLRISLKEEWQPPDRSSACGAFFVVLYIWDRSPNSLELSHTNRNDLNQMNGISIYRDGIRILPYGEPNDDWLEIDKARYMTSSGAFSRKNVVGSIEITQDTNKRLRDKSNREGFIENEAFFDLYNLMRAVMKIAFNEFAEDRKKIREAEKAAKKEIAPAIVQLETSTDKVAYALDTPRTLISSLVEQGKVTPDVAKQILDDFNQTVQALETAVADTKQAATDTLTTLDEEREMLLALAGLGLAAERFTHEFARLTREAADLIRQVKRRLPVTEELVEVVDRVNTLRVTLEALQDLVLALGPMFYVRHKTREKELNVKTIVSHALLLNQGQIKDNRIQVEIDEQGELTVVMREGALTQVFNNLIDNACYWLSRKSQENDRRLRITFLGDDQMVVVADNGPGIQPNYRHRIFDLFFSTKVDGRGLGLFISRETLAEAKATIELLEPGSHPATFRVGAAFKIQFSN